MPQIFETNSDDYIPLRSVDFRPDLDGSGSGPTPMVRTRHVRGAGFGNCSHPDTFRPTIPQPGGRKHRAGDQGVSGPDIEQPVRREGALWGTPRKRALFGLDGLSSTSSGSGVPEGRSGRPPDDEYPGVAQSG